MVKAKTPKQLAIKIRSLKKQVTRLEQQKKRATAARKKKPARKRKPARRKKPAKRKAAKRRKRR